MSKARDQGPSGALVIDKPERLTSHDVVARARKLLHTRRIGHAGTLDPMATGVLVLLVGEATKLVPFFTAHDKRYDARVVFGLSTDTLDREGQAVTVAEPPSWLRDELAAAARGEAAPRIEAALASERARTLQAPPAFSAIKVGGQPSYARARAGEEVDLAERAVAVRSLEVVGADADAERPWLDLSLCVSKGYYVRSLARDLGAHLGTPSHLGALRRTASGPFTLSAATQLDAGAEAQRAALMPLAAAAEAALPRARLSREGARKARLGQPLREEDFDELPSPQAAHDVAAWFDEEGRLIAVGQALGEALPGDAVPGRARFQVLRGFADERNAGTMERSLDPTSALSGPAKAAGPTEVGPSVLAEGQASSKRSQ